MTEFLKNVQGEPAELAKSLAYTLGPGRDALDRAARRVREARNVVLAGIGASWHAAMGPLSLFDRAGRPAQLFDASEILHFAAIPPETALVLLSRSGKSIEVVDLLDRARAARAKVIGVTNTPDSPLAKRSDVALLLEAAFDHAVSITMYSAPALVAGLLAEASLGTLDAALADALKRGLEEAGRAIPRWRGQLEGNGWFAKEATTYFLARSGSLASAHEARLLWEEGAKAPATAMATGGFRHGPWEILKPGVRVGIWLDAERRREQDLALARDLRGRGAKVMVVGQSLPKDAGDLAFEVPALPARWQFLADVIPAQLAAEHLAGLRGADCDKFLVSSYIVQAEGGLKTQA